MNAPGVIVLTEDGQAAAADPQALKLLDVSSLAELATHLAGWPALPAGITESHVGGLRLLIVSDPRPLQRAETLCEDVRHLLSHDLRAPIATAISLSESGTDGTFPASPELFARVGELAGEALERADSALQLLRTRSLDPARFDAVDLVRILHEASEERWARARKHKIVLKVDDSAAADGEALVSGDIDMLRRALVELIDNAIRHGRAPATILIRIDASESSWTVSVRDEGPGIAATDLPKLFEAPQRRGRSFGYGAGLALVRLVAEAHHAHVSVESTNAGNLFCLTLPRLP
ncbi:sensor histidine kinase [Niveibacterium terrae]|uniref:sensor histidine kinase n=1 Tax=Niveibacterium terrae TaxID=3373598 RepID=UPI003A95B279